VTEHLAFQLVVRSKLFSFVYFAMQPDKPRD
jgi:hypothetical protein